MIAGASTRLGKEATGAIVPGRLRNTSPKWYSPKMRPQSCPLHSGSPPRSQVMIVPSPWNPVGKQGWRWFDTRHKAPATHQPSQEQRQESRHLNGPAGNCAGRPPGWKGRASTATAISNRLAPGADALGPGWRLGAASVVRTVGFSPAGTVRACIRGAVGRLLRSCLARLMGTISVLSWPLGQKWPPPTRVYSPQRLVGSPFKDQDPLAPIQRSASAMNLTRPSLQHQPITGSHQLHRNHILSVLDPQCGRGRRSDGSC